MMMMKNKSIASEEAEWKKEEEVEAVAGLKHPATEYLRPQPK
jgi:hypothetical protein